MSKRANSGISKEELRMNMASLQRIDPFISQIVISASQVALYKYVNNEWEKTDIEGSMFVYERKCDPKYGFLILNRRSATNWIQPIVADIDTQIQPPFILYKTKDGNILGIWFYERRECEQIGESLISLVKRSVKTGRSPAASGGTDLAALLMKASGQNPAANEQKAMKSSPSGGEKLLRLLSREADSMTSSQGGPPMALAPSTNSVAAFFAQASQQEQNPFAKFVMDGVVAPQAMIPGFIPPHQAVGIVPFGNKIPESQVAAPDANSNMMIQNLLSNPGVVSVETLERAHREESQTPPMTSSEMPPMPLQATKANDLEADLKSKLRLNQNAARGNKQGNTPSSSGKPERASKQQQQPQQQHQQRQHGKQQQTPLKPSYASAVAGESNKAAVQKSPAPKRQQHHNQLPQHQQQHNQLQQHQQQQNQLPQHQQQHNQQQQHQPQQAQNTHRQQQHTEPVDLRQMFNNMRNEEAEVELMSPMAFAASDAAVVVPPHVYAPPFQMNGNFNHFEPLTQGQLVQALVHLLHTDDQFVVKLHQAYLDTLKTKLH